MEKNNSSQYDNQSDYIYRDLFSKGAMGALEPAILKIGLLAPTILGQSITVITL